MRANRRGLRLAAVTDSPRTWARTAGVVYLLVILLGAFAIGAVPSPQGHETLYRIGLAAHAAVLSLNMVLAAIFYYLFKVVSRLGAMLVVLFTILGTAVEGAGLVNQLASYSSAQVQAAYVIQQTVFAFYGITAGYLIYRSTFLPRFVGVLLAIGGLSYLAYSFAAIIAPSFAGHLVPWIQLPSGLGEISFCLALLIVGVNVGRWNERAAAAAFASAD